MRITQGIEKMRMSTNVLHLYHRRLRTPTSARTMMRATSQLKLTEFAEMLGVEEESKGSELSGRDVKGMSLAEYIYLDTISNNSKGALPPKHYSGNHGVVAAFLSDVDVDAISDVDRTAKDVPSRISFELARGVDIEQTFSVVILIGLKQLRSYERLHGNS